MLFQSVVLYGLFPHVLQEILSVLRSEGVYSLHFKVEGAYIVVSLVYLEHCHVRTVYLGVAEAKEGWELEILRVLANFFASDAEPGIPGSIVVDDVTKPIGKVKDCIFLGNPAIVKNIGNDWLVALIRAESVKVFHGVEPLSVVEFLRMRFLSASSPTVIVKFPMLKSVIIK